MSKSDVGMQEYGGMLKIILYGASKLPAKDLNGTSDPVRYLIINNSISCFQLVNKRCKVRRFIRVCHHIMKKNRLFYVLQVKMF